MITKQDILDRASEWQLRPEVVEKDYVLAWLLAAIAEDEILGRTWVFKGGTCIKKCYVETYRFSEDLDFSLTADAPYTEGDIKVALERVAQAASQQSGIEFPADRIEVRPRRNKQGQPTFEVRMSYRGPLQFPGYPRVLIDLTQHEPVLDPPASISIFHPYPDALPDGLAVRAYTLNELLAEKTRALYERTRPRDLYDVVYLLENQGEAFDLPHARGLLAEKCRGKNLLPPSARELIRTVENEAELQSEWANMLAHQLPVLPGLPDLLSRLPALIAWVDQPAAALPELRLPSAPVPAAHVVVAPAGIHYWGGGSSLESIRFASANRLLVEFMYNGTQRLVEPYALRQAGTGNLLLYGWEVGATHIKAFNVANMSAVKATSTSFVPRYRIELTPHGTISIPMTAAPVRSGYRTPVRRTHRTGPTYVFQCPYCQKEFRHNKNDPVLRKHKIANGYWDCPSRHGYLLRVDY
jgi:predicted nucleotidyltransferase component of viral defense system